MANIRKLGSHELPSDVPPFPQPPTLDRRYLALTSFAAVVAWRFGRRPKLRRYGWQCLYFWCVPLRTCTTVPSIFRRVRWAFMPAVVISDAQAERLALELYADRPSNHEKSDAASAAVTSKKSLVDDAIWQSCRDGRMWDMPWAKETAKRNVRNVAANALSEVQSVIVVVPASEYADHEHLRLAFQNVYPHVRVEAVEACSFYWVRAGHRVHERSLHHKRPREAVCPAVGVSFGGFLSLRVDRRCVRVVVQH
jgi:hypothetical protein